MPRPASPRASRPGPAPAPPRLPVARALERLRPVALEDDTAYADGEIAEGRFAGATASRLTLTRVVLRDVDLTAARLDKLTLTDVRLTNCDLANAVWRESTLDRVELIGCRVTGLDLTEASATSLVLRDCVGSLASFRFARTQASAIRELRAGRGRFPECRAHGGDLPRL